MKHSSLLSSVLIAFVAREVRRLIHACLCENIRADWLLDLTVSYVVFIYLTIVDAIFNDGMFIKNRKRQRFCFSCTKFTEDTAQTVLKVQKY